MLELLRNAVKSWVMKVLLGLLVISFAAWGVGDMLGARGGRVAATVGDREITTLEFRREFNQTLQQFQGLDVFRAQAMGLDQVVLTQLALNVALDQEAEEMGVGASDQQVFEAIREQPAFHNAGGTFDDEAYRSTLRFNGLRARDYEAQIRGELSRARLLNAVASGAAAPRSAQEAIWLSENQTRNVRYFVLDEAALPEPAAPTEEQLAAFHEENGERFSSPEYREISYIWLRADDFLDADDVTENEARSLYETRSDQYSRPERRNVERIVFDTREEADAAAARLGEGESFEKIAEERALAQSDIALGYVTREELPADLADAAFGPRIDGLVGPVETAFGWTLVNLRGFQEAEVTPFEDVADELKREAALLRARDALPDLANAVEELRAAGATLLEVGEKEGATAKVVSVDRDGFDPEGARVPDLPSDPGFLERVFAAEIGEEMDLAETNDGGFYAVLVEEVTPSALRPIETVRERVEAAYAAEARRRAVEEAASAALARIDAGETLEAVAEDLGRETASVEGLGRQDSPPDLTPAAVGALFNVEKGGAVERALDGGRRRVVASVVEIIEADPAAGADEIALQQERAGDAISLDILELYRRAALEARDYQTFPGAVTYALGLDEQAGGHSGM